MIWRKAVSIIMALSDRLHMIHGDIKEIAKQLGYGKFDVVTCNPPYFTTPSKGKSMKMNIWLSLVMKYYVHWRMLLRVSSQLVKQGGKVAFVHRSGRLIDIITINAEIST